MSSANGESPKLVTNAAIISSMTVIPGRVLGMLVRPVTTFKVFEGNGRKVMVSGHTSTMNIIEMLGAEREEYFVPLARMDLVIVYYQISLESVIRLLVENGVTADKVIYAMEPHQILIGEELLARAGHGGARIKAVAAGGVEDLGRMVNEILETGMVKL